MGRNKRTQKTAKKAGADPFFKGLRVFICLVMCASAYFLVTNIIDASTFLNGPRVLSIHELSPDALTQGNYVELTDYEWDFDSIRTEKGGGTRGKRNSTYTITYCNAVSPGSDAVVEVEMTIGTASNEKIMEQKVIGVIKQVNNPRHRLFDLYPNAYYLNTAIGYENSMIGIIITAVIFLLAIIGIITIRRY